MGYWTLWGLWVLLGSSEEDRFLFQQAVGFRLHMLCSLSVPPVSPACPWSLPTRAGSAVIQPWSLPSGSVLAALPLTLQALRSYEEHTAQTVTHPGPVPVGALRAFR